MGGMDKIVNKYVFGTVNAILPVITWLVYAKKAVTWVGQDPFATKVIVSLLILNGLTNNIYKLKSMIHLYFKKKEYFITVWYAKRCNKCSNSASLSQRLRYQKPKTTTTKNNNNKKTTHVTVQMYLAFVGVVTDYIFLYLIFSLWWWISCFSSLIMEKTTHNFLKILTVSCQGLGENKKKEVMC